MTGFSINLWIPRTNPLVLRRMLLDRDAQVQALVFAAARAFGLPDCPGALVLDGQDADMKKPLSALLKKGGTGALRYDVSEVKAPLEIQFEVADEAAMTSANVLPQVELVLGLNVPERETDPRQISFIQRSVMENGTCILGTVIHSTKGLTFSEKRFVNAMKKRFDPLHADEEVNMALGMPLQVILSRMKMTELKEVANNANVNYYNPIRKAELVEAICRHCGPTFLKLVLENLMTAAEYESFRAAAVKPRIDNRDIWRLPTLLRMGLAGDFPGEAVLAQELLEYFSDLYGTQFELQSLWHLQMNSALRYCCEVYGLFSRNEFIQVAKVRTDGVLTDESYDGFWKHLLAVCR